MSSDRPGKGLWGRLKDVLGVSHEEDDGLDGAPQVTSTFTAHRIPGSTAPLSGPLFPEAGDERKWELYDDGWEQDPPTPGASAAPPAAPPTSTQPAPPEPPPPAEPHAEPPPPAEPPFEPHAEPHRHEEPRPAVAEHPEPPAARQHEPPVSSTGRPRTESQDLSSALESLVDEGDGPGLLAHVDDDAADALAAAFGFDRLPPRAPTAPAEAADPAIEEPAVEPPDAHLVGTDDERTHTEQTHDGRSRDAETQRQIEVHEDRLAQAQGRTRPAPRPGVNVHDAHLEGQRGPVTLTPSEALALAERGRDAIGPRKDVGPAS